MPESQREIVFARNKMNGLKETLTVCHFNGWLFFCLHNSFFLDARLGDTQEEYRRRVSEKKVVSLEKLGLGQRSVQLLSCSLVSLKIQNQQTNKLLSSETEGYKDSDWMIFLPVRYRDVTSTDQLFRHIRMPLGFVNGPLTLSRGIRFRLQLLKLSTSLWQPSIAIACFS